MTRDQPCAPGKITSDTLRTDSLAGTEEILELREAQKLAWDNKIAKGFNTTDVALEFGLLTAEVGEAFTAWRKRLPDFGEELADVAIYLMSIAEMNGIDLDTEVANKIAKNATRTYERNAAGVLTRRVK